MQLCRETLKVVGDTTFNFGNAKIGMFLVDEDYHIYEKEKKKKNLNGTAQKVKKSKCRSTTVPKIIYF